MSRQKWDRLDNLIGRYDDIGGDFTAIVAEAQIEIGRTLDRIADYMADDAARPSRYVLNDDGTGSTIWDMQQGIIFWISESVLFVKPMIDGDRWQQKAHDAEALAIWQWLKDQATPAPKPQPEEADGRPEPWRPG